YPLQGNYGISTEFKESSRIQVAGLVVSHETRFPSHHMSQSPLRDWLKREGVPALSGVDTRQITRVLREHGTILGTLGADTHAEVMHTDMSRVVRDVEPQGITHHEGGRTRMLLIDTGAKENILRCLLERGATVIRAGAHAPWEPYVNEVDGVMLTNGP